MTASLVAAAGARAVTAPFTGVAMIRTGGSPVSVAFSPSGSEIAAADSSGSADVVEVSPGDTFSPAQILPVGGLPYHVAYSPDGSELTIANLYGGIDVFSALSSGGNYSSPVTLSAGPYPISDTFEADGSIVAADLYGGIAILQNQGGGSFAPENDLPAGSSPVSVAVSPDGQEIAVADYSGGLSILANAGGGTWSAPVSYSAGNTPIALAFSPDGTQLAVADLGGGVTMFAVGAGGALTSEGFTNTGGESSSVAFSPTGHLLAVANDDIYGGSGGYVTTWTVAADGTLSQLGGQLPGAGASPVAVAFSPDGTELATADEAGYINVLAAGAPRAAIASPANHTTVVQGAPVSTSFSCLDADDVLSAWACSDGGSGSAGQGSLDTSTVGHQTYAVTATSADGLTDTASLSYTVAAPPTVSITEPQDGAQYTEGQSVSASFSCQDGTLGTGIATCQTGGGDVTGSTLDTTTPGSRALAITAVSQDGGTTTTTVHYTVTTPPPPSTATSSSTTTTTSTTTSTSPISTSVTTTAAPTPTAPTAPAASACTPSSGAFSGNQLGTIALGMTRGVLTEACGQVSTGDSGQLRVVLTAGKVRVGYPAPRLLAMLAPAQRRRVRGHAVWISTAVPSVTLDGVSPGLSIRAAQSRLHFDAPLVVGLNTWYLARRGAVTAVLKVRHGFVREVGIGARAVTANRRLQRVFVTSGQ